MRRRILTILLLLAVPCVGLGSHAADHYDQRVGAVNARIKAAQQDINYSADIKKTLDFLATFSAMPSCMIDSPVPMRSIEDKGQSEGARAYSIVTECGGRAVNQTPAWAQRRNGEIG
jgi:hypothetical protein